MMDFRRVVSLGAAVGLLLIAGVETVAAAGSTFTPPEWALYVGLALFCPEELKAMVRDRRGNTND